MRSKQNAAFLCGILGCLCYGGGDWLMMYGSTAHSGAVSWLTEGTASIPGWRYDLAMALAFPGIILYSIALFSVQSYIKNEKDRKIYHYLNAFGLTQWIALHLFYIMILPVFIYWFYLQISGKTIFPKRMAFTNILLIFGALKCLTLLMPDSAFRLGFTNGLMSESMVIWFAIMMIYRSKIAAIS